MRRTLLIAILSLILVLCQGCWDRQELDTIGIVSAFGIDLAETPGQILVTAQLIRPAASAANQTGGSLSGKGSYWVIRATGSTVFDAIRNLSEVSSRKPFFSHNQVIVIGEELARQGVFPHLDVLLRDEEARPTAWVAVCKGTAAEFINSDGGFQAVSGFGFGQLLENQSSPSKVAAMKLQEFHRSLSSKSRDSVASLFEAFAADRTTKSRTPSASPLDPATPSSDESELTFRLIGTAVFKADRWVGDLNLVEGRGYLWAVGEIRSSLVVVSSPSQDGSVGIEVLASQARIVPIIDADGPRIRIEIATRARLGCQQGPASLATSEGLSALTDLYEKAISDEVTQAISKAKELHSDIFGFGETFRESYPRVWRTLEGDWEEIFERLPVDVSVRAQIKRFGVISDPAYPKQR